MAFDLMYEAMKQTIEQKEWKELGFKSAAQNILYLKQEPYFWTVAYYEGWKEQGQAAGTKYVRMDLCLKYCHYDELQYSILYPGQSIKFSNKLRANSKQKCRDRLWSRPYLFPWDDEKEDYNHLAEEILRTACAEMKKIMQEAEEMGGVDAYFIAHPELNPRLSVLACIDKKDYAKAQEILMKADASKEVILINAGSEEQLTRLKKRYPKSAEGITTFGRDTHDIFADYCLAAQQGLEWTADFVLYSLPL